MGLQELLEGPLIGTLVACGLIWGLPRDIGVT